MTPADFCTVLLYFTETSGLFIVLSLGLPEREKTQSLGKKIKSNKKS